MATVYFAEDLKHDRKVAIKVLKPELAATVNLTNGFTVSDRRVVYEGNFVSSYTHASFDISPDGKRLLLLKATGATVQTTVVYDWLAELRAKLAGRVR